MAMKPWTNTGETPVHIGGKLIGPGETRDVEETLIPDYAPAAREPDLSDPVLEILDHKVAEIAGILPQLSDEELRQVEQAEQDGKTRKGVMEAIAEEWLRRASGAQGDDPGGPAADDPGGEPAVPADG